MGPLGPPVRYPMQIATRYGASRAGLRFLRHVHKNNLIPDSISFSAQNFDTFKLLLKKIKIVLFWINLNYYIIVRAIFSFHFRFYRPVEWVYVIVFSIECIVQMYTFLNHASPSSVSKKKTVLSRGRYR